jgi:hypothetical protein
LAAILRQEMSLKTLFEILCESILHNEEVADIFLNLTHSNRDADAKRLSQQPSLNATQLKK